MSKMDLSFFCARVILGSIFAVAGFSKILDTQYFLANLRQLDLLPHVLILPVGISIVGSEIAFGLALIVGFHTRTIAAMLSGLILLFISAIAIALLRGSSADCGCFGSLDSERIGPGIIARDLLLLGGCLWLVFRKDIKKQASSIAEEKERDERARWDT